jgi:hypothetical protein
MEKFFENGKHMTASRLHYRAGLEAEKFDKNKAKENYLISAKLGNVGSMVRFAELLDPRDPKKWFWLAQAALRGCDRFQQNFYNDANNVILNDACKMEAGRYFNRTFYYKHVYGSYLIEMIQKVIIFYKQQIDAHKEAVKTWTLVGMRNGVVKDMRKLIGEWIWAQRNVFMPA